MDQKSRRKLKRHHPMISSGQASKDKIKSKSNKNDESKANGETPQLKTDRVNKNGKDTRKRLRSTTQPGEQPQQNLKTEKTWRSTTTEPPKKKQKQAPKQVDIPPRKRELRASTVKASEPLPPPPPAHISDRIRHRPSSTPTPTPGPTSGLRRESIVSRNTSRRTQETTKVKQEPVSTIPKSTPRTSKTKTKTHPEPASHKVTHKTKKPTTTATTKKPSTTKTTTAKTTTKRSKTKVKVEPEPGLPEAGAEDKEDEEEEEEDDNALYCFCHGPSFGRMVACDNPKCELEWFHYKCVGLFTAPENKWFCTPKCELEFKEAKSAQRKKKRRKRSGW
ncbi:unnamed protein product [Ambrosiozyma monospora]|uniref:Unnamed protein product n=1 Tax=Ambrosiozyma monospora TaxID=43982 RepID=A0ACB5T836_AMBMO|nr:unnamed protein product [Ambrosiozyma monospora]